jgi:hypothetical protein
MVANDEFCLFMLERMVSTPRNSQTADYAILFVRFGKIRFVSVRRSGAAADGGMATFSTLI